MPNPYQEGGSAGYDIFGNPIDPYVEGGSAGYDIFGNPIPSSGENTSNGSAGYDIFGNPIDPYVAGGSAGYDIFGNPIEPSGLPSSGYDIYGNPIVPPFFPPNPSPDALLKYIKDRYPDHPPTPAPKKQNPPTWPIKREPALPVHLPGRQDFKDLPIQNAIGSIARIFSDGTAVLLENK